MKPEIRRSKHWIIRASDFFRASTFEFRISARPFATYDGVQFEFRRVEHGVLHALALPGVGDVHKAVAGLDDSRIGILPAFVFENHGCLPCLSVSGKSDIQRAAARPHMIIDQLMA